MQARNRWCILAIVASTLFLIVIDMTVLYTALPSLAAELSVSASEKLWIINAYPLAVAGLLPAAGLLSDSLGHRRLFLAGLPVFGLASLACAVAPSAAWLIAGRTDLAVGAAMMMPATLAIVRQVFTDEAERALAIGIWAAIASGAAALGPIAGGLLLTWYGWRSVFLVNVPIVLLVLPAALLMLPRQARRGRPLVAADAVDTLLAMPGLAGLVYALKEAGKPAPDVLAGLVAATTGTLALWVFFRRQRRRATPMIDPALFASRLFGCGILIALIASLAMVGIELALSQRLQLVEARSPLEAGLFLLPLPLAACLSGPLAGRLLPRTGAHVQMWGSLLLAGLATGAFALLPDEGPVARLACLAVAGFGIGAAFTAASTVIMQNTPEHSAGMAASIEDIAYEIGGVLGVTLLGSLMATTYSARLVLPDATAYPPSVRDSLDEALLAARQLGATEAGQLADAARAAFDHGYLLALLAGSLILLATSALAWRLGRHSRMA